MLTILWQFNVHLHLWLSLVPQTTHTASSIQDSLEKAVLANDVVAVRTLMASASKDEKNSAWASELVQIASCPLISDSIFVTLINGGLRCDTPDVNGMPPFGWVLLVYRDSGVAGT